MERADDGLADVDEAARRKAVAEEERVEAVEAAQLVERYLAFYSWQLRK